MRRHPYLTVWAVTLLLFFSPFFGQQEDGTFTALGESLKVLGGTAVFAGPIVTIYIWVRRFRGKRKAKKEILARCEYEHQLTMNGDSGGFYGRYTPTQLGDLSHQG